MQAFEKIIGYENEKKELMRVADVLKNPSQYAKLGAKTPNGLLINGKPGLGKTLMADCLIEASGRRAFICRKDKADGDFVNYIRETFEQAAENAPSIVFLDDMDKFANEDEERPNAEEYVTVQSCIDSVKSKEVFVLATTNKKHCLPDSLLRAGRFDRIIDVYPPTYEEGVKIIKHYLKDKDIMSDIEPEYIAKLLRARSCATIETIINEAAVLAGFERCEKIKLGHFITASMKTAFRHSYFEIFDGKIDLSDSTSKQSEIVYHEAGHAVVSEILSPESITLIAVGEHSGQTARFDATDDRDKNAIHKDAIVCFGGLAAVDHIYGQRGFGGGIDMNSARLALRALINNNSHFGYGFCDQSPDDSQSRRLKTETAMDLLCEQYYYKAKAILASNREFFDRLAHELAEKKVLTMYDVQRIKKDCPIREADLRW